MDWAVGLAANSGRLVAEIVGADDTVDLAVLQTRGVPADRSARRGCCHLDFTSWQRVDAEAYLAAFGIDSASHGTSGHQMFSAEFQGQKLMVPALVWIRALFRPSEYLLPLAFGPHFLDRVSYVIRDGSIVRVVPEAFLETLTRTKRLSRTEQAILWMHAHPSARSMTASVHRYAMEGVIGLDLPVGHAELAVRGKRVGKTLFVTDMSILVITAGDTPTESVAGANGRYVLKGSRVENDVKTTFKVVDFSDVPLHSDGRSDVTDAEWETVAPYLKSNMKAPSLDQRAILDGLLFKLSSGQSWKTVPYRAGSHKNAVQAFRNWAARGALQKVLEALRNLRAPVKN